MEPIFPPDVQISGYSNFSVRPGRMYTFVWRFLAIASPFFCSQIATNRDMRWYFSFESNRDIENKKMIKPHEWYCTFLGAILNTGERMPYLNKRAFGKAVHPPRNLDKKRGQSLSPTATSMFSVKSTRNQNLQRLSCCLGSSQPCGVFFFKQKTAYEIA